MKVTIGGDRIGSGNKMTTELKNYHRSTHNLSRSWRSTMAPGVLVPFLVEPALNGDSFEIDLNAMMRTIPTQGPLMGSFKLQMDVFQCPLRLYQGLLHNNSINIGMEMNKVLLPQVEFDIPIPENAEMEDLKDKLSTAKNSLHKYLGLSGIGMPYNNEVTRVTRNFNAVPFLAYYDIFKNYYANKQEEDAYFITGGIENNALFDTGQDNQYYIDKNTQQKMSCNTVGEDNILFVFSDLSQTFTQTKGYIVIKGTDLNQSNYIFEINNGESTEYIHSRDLQRTIDSDGEIQYKFWLNNNLWVIGFNDVLMYINTPTINTNYIISIAVDTTPRVKEEIVLRSFPLENIDKMRNELLSHTTLNVKYVIDDDEELSPYKQIVGKLGGGSMPMYKFAMQGLCVKTYQADLFNAWVNTEWIDGENGINAITTIDTSDGLKLDTLNLAQKVYNMLNRIAVSGGTYEDWQEAVYTQKAIRHAESPIYCGGMESEVVFDEVIQTATTSNESQLGTIGGRGTLNGKRGGYIDIKVHEPSIIMGIVSITPRIDYTQGNKWYMTDLFSINDLHKPALDGIGFQDLMEEQAAWWGTHVKQDTELIRHKIGKVPAWINYMTSFDEAFGDFAEENGKNFMILARNYEMDNISHFTKDLTTYIEPEKFNYAFAYQELAAQNFWCQIYTKIIARRIMSAKIIPNL